MSADTLPVRDGTDQDPPRRRGARGLRWLFAALLTLAVLCAGAAVTVWGWPGGAQEEESAAPAATATLEYATLLREESLDGTLGYEEGGSFFSRSDGVLTWLPEVGTELSAGQRAWEVDGAPVLLLRGDTPAYRTLEPGVEGADVRRFEQALAELGYGGFTVDDEYTWLTAEAVRRWQEDTEGVEATGTVGPERIWYSPGPVRVTGHEAAVGTGVAPGTPLLTTAATRRVVRVDLEVGDRDLVAEGDEVTVEMPDGTRADGEVESVGTVVRSEEEEEPGTGGGEDPTVEVVIALPEDGEGFLDQAPVTVLARGESREDVLTAPVGALIALPGGGYGVSVVSGDGTVEDVPVETGWFSDGLVEVSGDGIDAGTEVVVPE
ncbi:multidrug efflux pump subunit AcrA (membrane-fusion protein) [Nocardiopsis sp. Huas11]|uniref:peptidoglycan-binding protein n=1 Tax=Nocardiopsis sp. Huas11 TaxID=2183912 RepID=UPI000EB1E227|nr:peptidoglycan-binding protein [Nocardiopsis sp. Huas11]RKS10537.1 multidrug efflux pump subunit AcrA (membrane-fusion protein) [Nocardiopsis sp. Huas11]